MKYSETLHDSSLRPVEVNVTKGYHQILHGLSMFAVKAKIYEVIYNQSSSIAFDETSSYWSAHNLSAIHLSPRDSLISIGRHFVAARVVHLPKRTETRLITESDEAALITESNQVVRVVQ